MSNLTTTQISLPAHLQARLGKSTALSEAMGGGLSVNAYPRISIRGARWRIMHGSIETVMDNRVLRTIIVGASPTITKSFYAAKYDKNADPKGPDCYSLDGVRPAQDVERPESQLCASCPQNVWGSKQTDDGAKIKACLDQKRLAVVAAEAPGGSVYLLQITPSALKGFGDYHKLLLHKGYPPECVITEISFDPDASYPKMMFSFGGFISEETLATIDDLIGSPTVLEITGEITQKAKVIEAPKQAKPEPVRYVEPEVIEPEVIEPEVVVATPKAKKALGFGGNAVEAYSIEPKEVKTTEREPSSVASVQSSKLTDDLKGILADLDND